MSKKGSILLNIIPEDVQKYIAEIQGHEQVECLCKRSKEFTVYMIIREHREMTQLKQQINEWKKK
jgi:metal-sulfur cluster biosynthetic enzyme